MELLKLLLLLGSSYAGDILFGSMGYNSHDGLLSPEALDLTGSVTCTGPPPHPRPAIGSSGFADSNGDLMVCGGMASGEEGAHTVADCFTFLNNSWIELRSMGSTRAFAASVFFPSGEWWVFGGISSQDTSQVLSTTEMMVVEDGIWTPTTPLPSPLMGHCALPVGDRKVFITGGFNTEDSNMSRLNPKTFIMDIYTGSIEELTPLSNLRAFPMCITLNDGSVLVAGGSSSNDKILDKVEVYDPQSKTWKAGATLPKAIMQGSFVSLSGFSGPILVGGVGEEAIKTDTTLWLYHHGGWVEMAKRLQKPRVAGLFLPVQQKDLNCTGHY